MKIGIYGGSFDPIHNGHLKLAHAAILELGLDKVIFVPCGISAYQHKKSNIKADYRISLLIAALKKYRNIFYINYYEITQNKITYTIDTVKYFKEIYGQNELCLLFGQDTGKNFYIFKDYKKIQKLVKVYFSGCDFMDEQISLSSTLIRKKIQKGFPITGLVPKEVEEKIIEWELYK